jgi:hypothetical protein
MNSLTPKATIDFETAAKHKPHLRVFTPTPRDEIKNSIAQKLQTAQEIADPPRSSKTIQETDSITILIL